MGWEREEIHVTGTLGEDVERLDIEGDEKRLRIGVVLPKRARNVGDTDLEVRVPRGCDLKVSTVSADIEAVNVNGRLYLKAVSGDVTGRGQPEEVEVESVSGDIELHLPAGTSARLRIAAGSPAILQAGEDIIETLDLADLFLRNLDAGALLDEGDDLEHHQRINSDLAQRTIVNDLGGIDLRQLGDQGHDITLEASLFFGVHESYLGH